MGDLEGLHAGKELDKRTFNALLVFKLLTRTAEGRRAFLEATSDDERQRAFDRLLERKHKDLPGEQTLSRDEWEDLRGVQYATIPDGVRAILERLSDSELALLSDLDAAYVEAGMSLDSNPASLIVH